MAKLDTNSALVLFSGGQDSTVCLAWALQRFRSVETIGFDYGQRHEIEMTCRSVVRDKLAPCLADKSNKLADDHVVAVPSLNAISETALTRQAEISMSADGLPNTFVPGRNIVFLTLAAALAYRRGIRHVVGGMCETDYSGYPDCRDDAIKAMQVALNIGMESDFVLHTPLMWTDKADTWQMAQDIGGKPLVDLIIEETHTCYLGERTKRHVWGYGCGTCPACELRQQGYERFIGRGAEASGASAQL